MTPLSKFLLPSLFLLSLTITICGQSVEDIERTTLSKIIHEEPTPPQRILQEEGIIRMELSKVLRPEPEVPPQEHHRMLGALGYVGSDNQFDNIYTGNFSLGSNKKNFRVVLDTGSSELWVPAANTSNTAYTSVNTFNCSSSTSCKASNQTDTITYGSGQIVGYWVNETVLIGNESFKITNQPMLLVYTLTGFSPSYFDGIMGIGYDKYNTDTVIQNLYKQNQISQRVLSFYCNDNDDKTPTKSQLVLGGYDSKYLLSGVNKFLYYNLTSTFYWQIAMQSVKIGNTTIITSNSSVTQQGIVDTGSSNLCIPSVHYTTIMAALNKIFNNTCNGAQCPCTGINDSRYPPIYITLGTQVYAIPPQKYMRQVYSGTCLMGFTNLGGTSNQWILGDVFLKSYYAVFDFENARVGLAPSISYVGTPLGLSNFQTTVTNTTNTTTPTNTTNTTTPTNTTTTPTNTTNTTTPTNTTNTTTQSIAVKTSNALKCNNTQSKSLPLRSTILNWLNIARQYPSYWSSLLTSNYSSAGTDAEIAAAVAALKAAPACTALTEPSGLDFVAQTHANWLKNGFNAVDGPHVGCGKSQPWDRIEEVGTWGVTAGENVIFGETDPATIVAKWLVSPGHRANIMDCRYKVVGLGLSTSDKVASPIGISVFAGSFACTGTCPALPPMDANFSCTLGYTSCANSTVNSTNTTTPTNTTNTTTTTPPVNPYVNYTQTASKLSCYATQQSYLPSRSAIISQLNSARANAASWATLLKNKYFYLTSSANLQAVISKLSSAQKCFNLSESYGIDGVAQDHANYLKNGWVENPYDGCNGNSLSARLAQESISPSASAEIISMGVSDAQLLVAQWLLDQDNLLENVIFNCSYTQVGLGLSTYNGNASSAIVVADFTGSFVVSQTVTTLPPMDVKFNCSANGYLMCSALPTVGLTQVEECLPTQTANLPQRSSLIEQINSVRSNPSVWISLIGTTYSSLGNESQIQEAIAFLQSAQSCGNLSESKGLNVGAQNYANFIKNGVQGDSSCNMSSLKAAIFEIADWNSTTQSITYGFLSPEQLVAQWIINATDRSNIMNCAYNQVGVGFSTPMDSSVSGPIAVIDYATNFTCKNNNTCPSLPPMDIYYNCSAGGYPVNICAAGKLSTYLVTFVLFAVLYLIN